MPQGVRPPRRWHAPARAFSCRFPLVAAGAGRVYAETGDGSIAKRPRPDAAEPLDRDAQHEARRRIVHRGKLDVGAEVDVSEPLEQLRSSALRDARPSVDDEVLLEPGRVDPGSFEGERDSRIAAHVAELLLTGGEVC